MSKKIANLHKFNDSAFAIIGDDGLTNFGLIKGADGSALLIDADIRRMDEIDDAVQRTGCKRVRYLLNTHENFDHSSANDYFEKNGALIIGSDGCWQALHEDGEAKFAEMAGRSPELKTRFPDLKMGQLQLTFASVESVVDTLPAAYGQERIQGTLWSSWILAIPTILRILKRRGCFLSKNVWRNQKSGTVEEPGLCRPDCGGGVELPDRNGLVPHEDERYGRHEVRRAAKRVRVRKPPAV